MKRIDFLKQECLESGRVFEEVYKFILPHSTGDLEFDDVYKLSYDEYMNEDLPVEVLNKAVSHTEEIAARSLAEYISRDIDKEIVENIMKDCKLFGLLLNP